MDFKQLLYEYSHKTSEKKRGEFWWKNEKWNQPSNTARRADYADKESRKEKVERAFGKMDKMLRISSSARSSTNFLVSNNILAKAPLCDKCNLEMD